MPDVVTTPATRAAPDWDLVLKRNNVEKLKREKFPLEIVNEIPELAERDYLDISEEDMVRFQWYGLYQDKPKVGYFMLRIKLASGILTAEQYRTIGELSVKYGRDYTELATRQTVQLHWLQIKQFNEVFAAMDKVGLTSLGGCGDTVRNITGCPVAGLDADELFDCRPQIDQIKHFFLGDVTTSTCRESTRSPSRPARPSATRPRSTASSSSAPVRAAATASACASAAACRRRRASRAT